MLKKKIIGYFTTYIVTKLAFVILLNTITSPDFPCKNGNPLSALDLTYHIFQRQLVYLREQQY